MTRNNVESNFISKFETISQITLSKPHYNKSLEPFQKHLNNHVNYPRDNCPILVCLYATRSRCNLLVILITTIWLVANACTFERNGPANT